MKIHLSAAAAWCLLLPMLWAATVVAAEETVPPGTPGWNLLLQGRFDDADALLKEEMQKAGTAREKLIALEGCHAIAWTRADMPRCETLLKEMALLASSLPDGAGVRFLKRYRDRARALHRDTELTETLKAILQANPHPAVADAVRQELLLIHLRRREYEAAEAVQAQDGHVRLFARLIGPFRDEVGFQLGRIYEPERAPSAKTYDDGSGRPVEVLMDQPATASGRLAVRDLVPHTESSYGVYAVVLLEADAEQDVVLGVPGWQESALWLRGAPIFDPRRYKHAYRTEERLIRVHLAAGINPILMKSWGGNSLSLRVLSPGGGPADGVRAVADREDAYENWELLSLRGVLLSREVRPTSLRGLETLCQDPPPVPEMLWLAGERMDRGEVQEARGMYDRLLAAYPESEFALLSVAIARMQESSKGVDATVRLVKEAMDLYDRVLEINAESYGALLQNARHAEEQNQADRAIRLFRQAIEAAPEAVGARQSLAKLYAKRKWDALALEQYKAVVEGCPGADAMLAEYYDQTGREDLAEAIRDAQWEARRVGPMDRYRELVRRRRWGEAETLLEELLQREPTSRRRVRRLRIRLAEWRGDREQLRGLLEEQATEQPEDDEPREALADLAIEDGDDDAARMWLEEALAVQRSVEEVDPKLRRRLRALQGESWTLPEHDIDLSDSQPAEVKKEAYPEANHARLLEVVVHRIYPDRGHETFVHRAVKVFDRQGIGSLGEMNVPKEGDALIHCRTVQPDGTVFVPTSVENLDSAKATSMYGVVPGAVLDYAYREADNGSRRGSFEDRFQVEQFQVPLVRGRYVLILPTEMVGELQIEVTPDDLLPIVTEADGLTTMRWDLSDIAPRKPARFLPRREALSEIRVSLANTQPHSNAWELDRPEPPHTNAAIEAQALQIAEGAEDDAEVARRVYAWIAENIKDTPGARTARDAMALRSGGTQPRMELTRAMLQANGLRASPARVNARFTSRSGLSREDRLQALRWFHSGTLLHVDVPEAPDAWLRFWQPSKHYRPDALGADLRGALARVHSDRGLRFTWVEGESLELSHEERATIALGDDGSARVAGHFGLFGSLAGRFRAITEDPQQGPLVLERVAGSVYPKIELEESDKTRAPGDTPEPGEAEPFLFRFRGVIRQFCRPERGGLAFSPFQATTRAEQLMTPLPREEDWELPSDLAQLQQATYTAPPGWAFAEVPADRYWDAEGGLYVLDFTVEGDRLTVSRVLIVPAQRRTPKEYEALRRFLADVEQTHAASVMLRPIPVKAFGGYQTPHWSGGAMEPFASSRYAFPVWPEGLARPIPAEAAE